MRIRIAIIIWAATIVGSGWHFSARAADPTKPKLEPGLLGFLFPALLGEDNGYGLPLDFGKFGAPLAPGKVLSSLANFNWEDSLNAVADGYLSVEQTGVYAFDTASWNGRNYLFIDGKILCALGQCVTTNIELTRGLHQILIVRATTSGGNGVSIKWRPPGATALVAIPETALFHDPATSRPRLPGDRGFAQPGDDPQFEPGLLASYYSALPGQAEKAGEPVDPRKFGPPLNEPQVYFSQSPFKWESTLNTIITGYILVEEPGAYSFQSGSWGARRCLYVDGQLLADFGKDVTKDIKLTKGFHELMLIGFVTINRNGVSIEWRPPGALTMVGIPGMALFHKSQTTNHGKLPGETANAPGAAALPARSPSADALAQPSNPVPAAGAQSPAAPPVSPPPTPAPAVSAPVPVAGGLPPPPPAAALAKSRQIVHEIYSADYQDASSLGRRKLARKQFADSAAMQSDLVGKCPLLIEARDLAIAAGDAQTAVFAIDALGGSFAVDVNGMTAGALIAIDGKAGPEDCVVVVERGLRVLDSLIGDEHYDLAAKLAPAIHEAAVKSRKPPLLSFAKVSIAVAEAVIGESEKVKPSIEKLKTDPADPDANAAVGKFLCFYRGDWNNGLAALAKGADAKLQALARQDLANPADGRGCLAVAEGWWDLGSASPFPMKSTARWRGAYWYQRGLEHGLQGLAKVLAERRVAEAGPPPAHHQQSPVSAPPALPVAAPAVVATGAPPANPVSTPAVQQPVSVPPAHPVSAPPAQPVSAPLAQPVSTPPAHPVSTPPAHPVSAPPAHPVSAPPAQPVSAPPLPAAAPRVLTVEVANTKIPLAGTLGELVRQSAQINSPHYEPEDVVVGTGKPAGWRDVPPVLLQMRGISYSRGTTGVAEFEVTRSGFLLLTCNWSYQGNRSGDWTKTRLQEEDFIKRGWQPVDNSVFGGRLVRIESNNEQTFFIKHVEKGETYSLRCNKYYPPYAIVFK